MVSVPGRPFRLPFLPHALTRWVLAVVAVATLLFGLGALHLMTDATQVPASAGHSASAGHAGHGHAEVDAVASLSTSSSPGGLNVVEAGKSAVSTGVGGLGLYHCEGNAGPLCCAAAAACTIVLALLVLSLVARIPPTMQMLFGDLSAQRERVSIPAPPRPPSLTLLSVIRV